MPSRLAMIAIVVPDYDDAIAHYTNALGFTLLEDTDMGNSKRWVRMSAGGGSEILLARAVGTEQASAVGHQAGGRVGFFLHTNDFAADHARMASLGVIFEETPRRETYGTVAVFRDKFGNRWDLIEPA